MMLWFSRRERSLCLWLLGLSIGLCSSAMCENWPCWRGPRGDGSSAETVVPKKWDGESGEGILWQRDLPGKGHGSPVVWNNRLFLVSCLEDSQKRQLLCLDSESGETRWESTVFEAPLEIKHTLNSFASSTPATDGTQVFAAFLEVDGTRAPAKNVGNARDMTPGKIVVVAYSIDGEQLWISRPGIFSSVHGFCSNPVIYNDSVIINGDHDGESYIVALDRKTGNTIWKTPRANQTRSYATPLIREISGQDQLVLPGSHAVTAFDPETGKAIWMMDGPTEQFVASPVYNGKHFFVTAGFPTHHVVAIRPSGHGNISETHVDWHQTEVRSYVPSPILAGDFLLVADDRGTANCYDTQSGERFWNVRLGRKFSASPVFASGNVYFISEDGVTHVVRPGRKFDEIDQHALGQRVFASPAIADGKLYIRGEQSLFAIGEKS